MVAPNRRDAERREQQEVDAAQWAKDQKGWEPTTFKLPDGIEQYKIKQGGPYQLDFLPYVVGNGKPKNACRVDPGMRWFECEYHVHKIMMPNGKRSYYCCLWETWKKPCPVCQFQQNEGRNYPKDLIDSLWPQKRHLAGVNDKPGDMSNPIKAIDFVHKNRGLGFGEQLVARMLLRPDYGKFWTADRGMTCTFTVETEYLKVPGIDFLPRKHKYAPDYLKKMPTWDECLVEYSFNDLNELLHNGVCGGGGGSPNGQQGERDARDDVPPPADGGNADEYGDAPDAPAAPVTAEDMGITNGTAVMHDTFGECEVLGISKDRLKLKVRDGQGETRLGVLCSDVSVVGGAGTEAEGEMGDDFGDGSPTTAAAYEPAIGDEVTWEYKGNVMEGTILKLNPGKQLASVEVAGQDRPSTVNWSDLSRKETVDPDGDFDAGDAFADEGWGDEPTTADANGVAAGEGWGDDAPAEAGPSQEAVDAGWENWDNDPAPAPEQAPKPATKKAAAKASGNGKPPAKGTVGKPATAKAGAKKK